MQTYTLSSIQSMLGLSRSVIAGLIAAGFVTPGRGKRREYRFSFQDVVLLRTAVDLQAARIPPRKILRSLQHLKATLPSELPLTGLRIAAVGNEIAVREGDTQWSADSGQLLIDFEVRPASRSFTLLRHAPRAAGRTALDWFDEGVRQEDGDKSAAERAYRRAIELAPDFVDPVLNLGVLLCDAGRIADAVALYRAALKQRPREALLHFNLAVALDDLGQEEAALAHYEDCLRLDPSQADAHFNAARLHEGLGHATQAIRHYSAYRRLQR
jgi:tetratricopeptide (TPR) repeat protein